MSELQDIGCAVQACDEIPKRDWKRKDKKGFALLLDKIDRKLRGTEKPKETIESWELNDIVVKTNVGEQTHDFNCTLVKHYISKRYRSLFEILVTGKKNYFYRIDVVPKDKRGIRQNRDKDWLPGYSDEGNDSTSEFSIGLDEITWKKKPNLSREYLNSKIIESLKSYDEEYKREQNKKYHENKKWTNKTLFKKCFNSYHEEIGLFTAIYPFFGSDLSGWTDIISLAISNEDENGFGIDFALLGFHFYGHSSSLRKWFTDKVLKMKRCPWPNGMPWEEFRKNKQVWEKEHPVWNFFNTNWRFELGISRAKGLFYSPEYNGCTSYGGALWKRTMDFNPLRTRYWNII